MPNSIQIAPNPTVGVINIIYGILLNNAYLKIVNLLGETILRREKLKGNRFELDISNVANGIYFVELLENDTSYRVKIVKK